VDCGHIISANQYIYLFFLLLDVHLKIAAHYLFLLLESSVETWTYNARIRLMMPAVFKAVKRGEATNYRLTLKRVRRKARRRLTAIQQ